VKIVACVKEILDPDIASSVFQVDEGARKVILAPGLRSVTNSSTNRRLSSRKE
jgi:hypothetical protein